MRTVFVLLLCGVCFVVMGCGPKHKGEPAVLPLLGAENKAIDVTDQGVEKNYDALTLLRRGERFYEKEEYLLASGEFQRFLDLHPFHRIAPFVWFRLGMAHYHQIDAIDRDLEPVEKALLAFETLYTSYPQSPFARQAEEKISELQNHVAQREFYVGYFYYKKGAYPAAVARFQEVIELEESSPLEEKALYYAGLSQIGQDEKEEGSILFRRLLEAYPDSSYENKVRPYLKAD